MMNYEEAFLWTIVGDLENDAAKLIYADWLDEQHRPRTAHALRWMVKNNKIPVYDAVKKDKLDWYWYSDGDQFISRSRLIEVNERWRLPQIVFTFLNKLKRDGSYYDHKPHLYTYIVSDRIRQFGEAVECLGICLQQLKELYSV